MPPLWWSTIDACHLQRGAMMTSTGPSTPWCCPTTIYAVYLCYAFHPRSPVISKLQGNALFWSQIHHGNCFNTSCTSSEEKTKHVKKCMPVQLRTKLRNIQYSLSHIIISPINNCRSKQTDGMLLEICGKTRWAVPSSHQGLTSECRHQLSKENKSYKYLHV